MSSQAAPEVVVQIGRRLINGEFTVQPNDSSVGRERHVLRRCSGVPELKDSEVVPVEVLLVALPIMQGQKTHTGLHGSLPFVTACSLPPTHQHVSRGACWSTRFY
jgi:hypothetical protein